MHDRAKKSFYFKLLSGMSCIQDFHLRFRFGGLVVGSHSQLGYGLNRY